MIVPFVTLYTQDADINYVYPTFALLFVLSSLFYIVKLPSTALINVAGHFKETKWRALLEAGLSLGLSVGFTLLIGKNGVLVGTGIALGWRCVDAITYSCKYILQTTCRRSLIRLMVSLLNVGVFKLLSDQIQFTINSWIDWIVIAIGFSVVALLILVVEVLILEKESLKLVKSYFYRTKIGA
jgi:hypothetical protein